MTSIAARRNTLWLFPLGLVLAIVSILGLGSCSNVSHDTEAGGRIVSVLVPLSGASSQSAASRDYLVDPSVASVYVEIVQGASNVLGSDQMIPETGYWQKNFEVSSSGSAVVNAVAKDSSGKTIYTGSSDITILESGTTSLTVPMALADYAVGDTGPAGGIIFYDKGATSNGWRYLEAAPSDQNSGTVWWTSSYSDAVANDQSIGAGKTNTTAIIGTNGTGSYAASIAASYSLNGYADWFLPSLEELALMRTYLYERGRGGMSGAGDYDYYWSSSDYSHLCGAAYADRFEDGWQVNCAYSMSARVRAIREF